MAVDYSLTTQGTYSGGVKLSNIVCRVLGERYELGKGFVLTVDVHVHGTRGKIEVPKDDFGKMSAWVPSLVGPHTTWKENSDAVLASIWQDAGTMPEYIIRDESPIEAVDKGMLYQGRHICDFKPRDVKKTDDGYSFTAHLKDGSTKRVELSHADLFGLQSLSDSAKGYWEQQMLPGAWIQQESRIQFGHMLAELAK